MNTIEKGTVAKGAVAKGELNLSDFATTGVIGIKITSGNLAATVAENSGANQVIYTATAEDPDGGTTGFTFSLASNSDSAVSINSSTGVVTLADNPNHEVKSSYAFTIIASKGDFIDGTKTLTQRVENIDEVAPTFTSGTTGIAIIEGSLVGTLVYTATATDFGDTSEGFTFSITGGDSADLLIENVTESDGTSTGLVKIGVITEYAVKPSYSFTIVATDLLLNSSSQAVTFDILDANPPVFTSGTSVTVPESDGTSHSITTSSTVLYTAQATDANPALDGSGRYQITTDSGDGADGGLLNIDQDSGEVTLASGALDYSTKSSYVFTVKATDRAGNFTKQTVTLTVEQLPRFSTGSPHNVAENLSVNNVTIHGYSITDGTASAVSIYRVDGSNYSAGGSNRLIGEVATNSSTGIIRTEGFVPFDYETATSHTAVLRGVKTGTGSVFFSENIVYNVLNTNDNAPVITSGGVATSIAENSGANQVVYQVSATDADGGSGSWNPIAEITLSGTDASSFSVSNNIYDNYGQVTLLDNPDFETKPSYTFDVTVTDDFGNGNASAPQTVTLAITNVVDTVPTFTASTVTAGTVAEANSTPPSTAIYDVDTNLNDPEGAVTALSIANVSTGFVGFYIDSNNVIRTTNALDYETATSHDITIVASYTLADGTNGSVGFTLTVPVSNVDEVAPVFTSSSADQNIGANIPVPVDVYTAVATDTDSNTGTITYSLSDDGNGYFEIDSSTGVVTMLTAPTNPAVFSEWRPESSSYQKSITIVASDGTNSTSMTKTFTSIVNLVFDSLSPTIAENYYDGGGAPPRTKYNPGATPITTAQLLPGTALVQASNSAGTITDYQAFNFTSTPGGATGLLTHQPASGNFQLLSLSTHDDLDFETNGGEIDVSYRVQKTGTGNEFVYQDVAFTITLTDAPACNFTSSATATAVTDGTGGGTVVYTATADIFDLQSGSVVFAKNPVLDQSDFSLNSTTGELTLINNANHSVKSQYQVSLTAQGSLDVADVDTLTVTIPVLASNLPMVYNNEFTYGTLVRDTTYTSPYRTVDFEYDVKTPGEYRLFVKVKNEKPGQGNTTQTGTDDAFYFQDLAIGAIQILDSGATTVISSHGPQKPGRDANDSEGTWEEIRGFQYWTGTSAQGNETSSIAVNHRPLHNEDHNISRLVPAVNQYTDMGHLTADEIRPSDLMDLDESPSNSNYHFYSGASSPGWLKTGNQAGQWMCNSGPVGSGSKTGANDGIATQYWKSSSTQSATSVLPAPGNTINQVSGADFIHRDTSTPADRLNISYMRAQDAIEISSANTTGIIRVAYLMNSSYDVSLDDKLAVTLMRNYQDLTDADIYTGQTYVTMKNLYFWGETGGIITGYNRTTLGAMDTDPSYSGTKTGGTIVKRQMAQIGSSYNQFIINNITFLSSPNYSYVQIDDYDSTAHPGNRPTHFEAYLIRNAGSANETLGGSISTTRNGTSWSTGGSGNGIISIATSHGIATDSESALFKQTLQNCVPGGATDYTPVMLVVQAIS